MTKPNPNKPVSLRDRVRAAVKPGATIRTLAKSLDLSERDVSRVVSALRKRGEIGYAVPHECPPPKVPLGQALRASMQGSIVVDTAKRNGFVRAVPSDMMEQINAAVAAGRVKVCPPSGHSQTFPQGTALFSLVEVA